MGEVKIDSSNSSVLPRTSHENRPVSQINQKSICGSRLALVALVVGDVACLVIVLLAVIKIFGPIGSQSFIGSVSASTAFFIGFTTGIIAILCNKQPTHSSTKKISEPTISFLLKKTILLEDAKVPLCNQICFNNEELFTFSPSENRLHFWDPNNGEYLKEEALKGAGDFKRVAFEGETYVLSYADEVKVFKAGVESFSLKVANAVVAISGTYLVIGAKEASEECTSKVQIWNLENQKKVEIKELEYVIQSVFIYKDKIICIYYDDDTNKTTCISLIYSLDGEVLQRLIADSVTYGDGIIACIQKHGTNIWSIEQKKALATLNIEFMFIAYQNDWICGVRKQRGLGSTIEIWSIKKNEPLYRLAIGDDMAIQGRFDESNNLFIYGISQKDQKPKMWVIGLSE